MSNRMWRVAYGHWWDHRAAGHRVRAAFWGFLADRVVPLS